MESRPRSRVLACLGLALLLAAGALVSWGIAELGSLVIARLGSPSVWQVLVALIVAWLIAFVLPGKVGAPICGALQWWIVGTAIAALGLVVARAVDASPDTLYRAEAWWRGAKAWLGIPFAHDLLPGFLATGLFLSLLYARPLVVYFRLGRRLMNGVSVLLAIVTAASSFSFFTADGLDGQAARNYADRLGDVTLALSQSDRLIPANQARQKLARAIKDDPAAAAKALRDILADRLACAKDRDSCQAAIGDLEKAKLWLPHATIAKSPLPAVFAQAPRTAEEVQAQVHEQQRIDRQYASAQQENETSTAELREAGRAVVDRVIDMMGSELVGLVDLPNIGEAVGSVAETVFGLWMQAQIGEQVAANLPEYWQRLVGVTGRAIDEALTIRRAIDRRDRVMGPDKPVDRAKERAKEEGKGAGHGR